MAEQLAAQSNNLKKVEPKAKPPTMAEQLAAQSNNLKKVEPKA
jgi:hypothetical protein